MKLIDERDFRDTNIFEKISQGCVFKIHNKKDFPRSIKKDEIFIKTNSGHFVCLTNENAGIVFDIKSLRDGDLTEVEIIDNIELVLTNR